MSALFSLLIPLSIVSAPCTFLNNTDFFIPNQGATADAHTPQECCDLCRGRTQYFVYSSTAKKCYCKPTQGTIHNNSEGNIAGTCPGHPAPPARPPHPNYQGCLDPVSSALPYCDESLPIEGRVDWLVKNMS